MVEELSNLDTYTLKTLKRVYVTKLNGKKQFLYIPTIKDRCVQQLFKMVIEPITEAQADSFSFGFRPGRNAHQALSFLRARLNSSVGIDACYLLDAYIDDYFGKISHE